MGVDKPKLPLQVNPKAYTSALNLRMHRSPSSYTQGTLLAP